MGRTRVGLGARGSEVRGARWSQDQVRTLVFAVKVGMEGKAHVCAWVRVGYGRGSRGGCPVGGLP
jgi:hypothetical protein